MVKTVVFFTSNGEIVFQNRVKNVAFSPALWSVLTFVRVDANRRKWHTMLTQRNNFGIAFLFFPRRRMLNILLLSQMCWAQTETLNAKNYSVPFLTVSKTRYSA